MDSEDNVLIDREGKGADDKATFELRRKVLGKKIVGVRFRSDEEYEPGVTGATLQLHLEGGSVLMVGTSDTGMAIFISMNEEDTAPGRVM